MIPLPPRSPLFPYTTLFRSGRGDHFPVKVVERRRNLFALGKSGDSSAPCRPTVGNRELLDVAVRRRGINKIARWVCDRSRSRDLARACPAIVTRRRVAPEDRRSEGRRV